MNKKTKITILSILIIAFLAIAFFVINKNSSIISLDNSVNSFVNVHMSPAFLNSMLSITKICDVPESVVIILVFGIFLFIKNRKSLYAFIFTAFSGIIIAEVLKHIMQRSRPVNLLEQGFSFPSAHATISTIFLLSSIFLLAPMIKNRFSKIIFILATSIIFPLVAYSRIYLSVHWTSDVIAGVILGSLCFVFVSVICCQKKENVI